MTEDQAAETIVQTLSLIVGVSGDDLRNELNQAGDDWPYDSIVLAEVLVTLEEGLGFTVPMDRQTAGALRSVRGFARRLADLASAQEAA